MKKVQLVKNKNCKVGILKRTHLVWGIIGALGLVMALISLVILQPVMADLLEEEAGCTEPVRPENIVGCVGTERKKDLLQIYREAIEERISEPGNGCGISFIDIYEDFFDNIEMQKFPELYTDFLDYAIERQVGSDAADRVLKIADTLYELMPSVEAARAGLKISGYFKNLEYIAKYENLLESELNKMGYTEIINEKMETRDCNFWLGPTTAQLISEDDFRTRLSKVMSDGMVNLYDDKERPWTASGTTINVSLFSECKSVGKNQVYLANYNTIDLSGNSASFYAGVKNAPYQTILNLSTADFLESASLISSSETAKTYEKIYQVDFCGDEGLTDCERKELPLKLTVLAEPVYYGASAVAVGENVATVGPTKVLVEKNLSTVRVRTGVSTTIKFSHNFYASLPLENVTWQVSRTFPYDRYHFSIAEEQTTTGGLMSSWEGANLMDGKTSFFKPESIFYFNSKTSLRDYTKYLVQDSYKVQFNSPGTYKFCESVFNVGKSGEVTKVCAVFEATSEKSIKKSELLIGK